MGGVRGVKLKLKVLPGEALRLDCNCNYPGMRPSCFQTKTATPLVQQLRPDNNCNNCNNCNHLGQEGRDGLGAVLVRLREQVLRHQAHALRDGIRHQPHHTCGRRRHAPLLRRVQVHGAGEVQSGGARRGGQGGEEVGGRVGHAWVVAHADEEVPLVGRRRAERGRREGGGRAEGGRRAEGGGWRVEGRGWWTGFLGVGVGAEV
jgi:hypothetical protein